MQPTPWTLDTWGTLKDLEGETVRVTGISMPCGSFRENDCAYYHRNLLMMSPVFLAALQEIRDLPDVRSDEAVTIASKALELFEAI